VELDSEPIEGSMIDPAGITRQFSGWIELVSLLQLASTTPAAFALGPLPRGRQRQEEDRQGPAR
jgi:hypothetical protein